MCSDGKQSANSTILSVVEVSLLPIMFELGGFCCLHYTLRFRGENVKIISKILSAFRDRWKSSKTMLPEMAGDRSIRTC